MTAFYMVELAFPFPDERPGFDAFYSKHIDRIDDESAPLPDALLSYKPVALDMSFVERGILMSADAQPPEFEPQPGWVVRSMKPLHTRREV